MHDSPKTPAFLRKVDWISDQLSRLCLLLAGTAIVAMTGMFAWLVFGRYVLNDTPTWIEQVSHLLLMVIAFLGAAVGVKEDTHLSVVYFRTVVPSSIRTAFVALTDFLMAGFGGLMFIYGLELTKFKWASLIPLIQVPEGLRSTPLAICGVLVFLFSSTHLVRLIMGLDERKDNIE